MAILTFHNIDKVIHIGLNNYHPRRLKNLLGALKAGGYGFVSLADYINSSPDKNIVSITFDDGYESLYQNALPILSEMHLPATVFIPYGYAGKKAAWDYLGSLRNDRHLSREQIIEMADSGFEIASHGFFHIELTGLSERMMKLELEKSKKGLEDLTGKEVRFISYPFGRFNSSVESLAAELGYERGFSLSFFKKSRHKFTIPRYAVYSTDTIYSVAKKLGGGFSNRIERIKGAVMNSYSYGTVFLNKFKFQSRPQYY